MRRTGGHERLPAKAAADLEGRVAAAALAAAILLTACGGAQANPLQPAATPKTTSGRIDTDHGSRRYQVFDPGNAKALVLALHPAGGTGDGFRLMTGFNTEAATHHLLVVYPDSYNNVWNAGFCCPFASPPQTDDVAYLTALVDRLAKPGWKVFAIGFSNGGMMAYRLACQKPQLLAAIAVSGADSEECSPKVPLPAILHFQGTADQLTGNRVWAVRNGQWVNTEPSATARWKRLGAEVRLVTVEGGAHTWYRSNPDASAAAGDFFAERT